MTNTAIRSRGHPRCGAVPVLWITCALAWVTLIAEYRTSGNGPGTMGLTFPRFVVLWTLMAVAMMIPCLLIPAMKHSVEAPFAIGYLTPWVIVGMPMYALAVGVDHVVAASTTTKTLAASAALFTVAAYQFMATKHTCLQRARVASSARPMRAGVAAGIACVGCSGLLMACVMLVFGMMNLSAMVVAALLIRFERTRQIWRPLIAVAAGFAIVGVVVTPCIAAGLHAAPMARM